MDSAICRGTFPIFTKSSQDECGTESPEEVERIGKAKYVRQGVKWGMLAF